MEIKNGGSTEGLLAKKSGLMSQEDSSKDSNNI